MKKEQSVAWPSVAVSHGPAGMKPTEAKKPIFELVSAEAFFIRLPSGSSRRRRN